MDYKLYYLLFLLSSPKNNKHYDDDKKLGNFLFSIRMTLASLACVSIPQYLKNH